MQPEKKFWKSWTNRSGSFLPESGNLLLFTGMGIFLDGIAVQEASGVRLMWKVREKRSYEQA